eukprot:5206427-Amphidinium_carterae.1
MDGANTAEVDTTYEMCDVGLAYFTMCLLPERQRLLICMSWSAVAPFKQLMRLVEQVWPLRTELRHHDDLQTGFSQRLGLSVRYDQWTGGWQGQDGKFSSLCHKVMSIYTAWLSKARDKQRSSPPRKQGPNNSQNAPINNKQQQTTTN